MGAAQNIIVEHLESTGNQLGYLGNFLSKFGINCRTANAAVSAIVSNFVPLNKATTFQCAGGSFWFAGDTGYNGFQFAAVKERLGPVDVAMIPIGAYAPRWFMRDQHVDPKEAVCIHNDVGSKLSIGMHWATFQLSGEPLMEPKQKLEKLVAEGYLTQGDFVTMSIGEILSVTRFFVQYPFTIKNRYSQ